MGSFAPSPTPDSIDFSLPVTDDAINEDTEVYILYIEIITSSEPVTLENGGVSRVLIVDNDGQYIKNYLECVLWYQYISEMHMSVYYSFLQVFL